MRFRRITTRQPLARPGQGPASAGGSPLLRWWRARDSITRQWLINVLVGLAIHLFLVINHYGEAMGSVENMALDRVMRINAVLDPAPESALVPPQQTFVDIDEAVWRSRNWGGGEPYRAPREQLLALTTQAFRQGATEVVLDIAVEGAAARAAEAAEDALFAAGVQKLLDENVIGPRQLLVLVRSARTPLPGTPAGAYMNELREAPAIDSLLARGDPRLTLAAPAFTYSGDRVLRDWNLFSVLCQRGQGGASGSIRVLPSVQLVVMAHRVGVPASSLPGSGGPCTSFPAVGQTAPGDARIAARNAQARRAASDSYWQAVAAALPARGIRIGAEAPRDGGVGNRVVYRSGYPFAETDPYFERMTAPVLLQSQPGGMLDGRVVVIGQSYEEGGDIHFTPLGTMPGSAVLMNAIDSMARYGLVAATSPWLTVPLALLAIIVIGYVFARLDSFTAKLVSTGVILALFALASVYLFRSGFWLDFALPLVGIQIYQTLRSYAERLDKLRRQAGIGPGTNEAQHG